MNRIVLLTGLLLFSLLANGKYSIQGKVSLSQKWHPVIYLASLNSPDDIFVASPDFIINKSAIDDEGNFLLTGDDLPGENLFYRLYVTRNEDSAVEFYPTSDKNFVHLLLHNKSEITLESRDLTSIFGELQLTGSPESIQIWFFEKELGQKKVDLANQLSRTKRELAVKSLSRYIKTFVRSTDNSLVALFAIYHIEDKEADFLDDSDFYLDFHERFQRQFPQSSYLINYNELLNRLVRFRNTVCRIPDSEFKTRNWIIAIEGMIIALLLAVIIWLMLKVRKLKQKQALSILPSLIDTLTQTEKDVLELLVNGLTNKEIAVEKHVELSTVKTHLNNIYKKLGVLNRNEAIIYYQSVNQ